MQMLIAKLLAELGEDPSREGLRKTPERVAKSLRAMTEGYAQDPLAILRGALFTHEGDGLVTVSAMPFHSLCEHHMLPFFGVVHVAYQPNGKIVGLSKLPRVIDAFARRLQVQERLTNAIADALQEALNPRGLAVVMRAEHLCVRMRGVGKSGSVMHTSILRGSLRDDASLRETFFTQIGAEAAALK